MRPDELRKFQKKFIKEAFRPEIDTAVLSVPRGNGKTALAGHILSRCLTIGDPLCQPGSEYLLCAASIEQARLCFRFIRQDIEPRGGYRFIDSATRIGITHLETQTRLRVLSSNGKTSMGIVGCPVLVADESGSWETVGGGLMADAIFTAQGKPGSQMKVIFIGTLAPATSGWWHELVNDGSYGSTYVQALTGDRTKWDYWPEIRRCNPLTAISQVFCRKLREERDAAHRDSRLRARFLSYRMNVPSGDESTMLLTVDDFERMAEREPPPPQGQPLVAVDLGAGRAWSAAVAVWRSGRIEAMAVAPGIPDLATQEKRDRVDAGTYQKLYDAGLLEVAEGLRVQPPGQLWEMIKARWGVPVQIVSDFFQVPYFQDAVAGAVNVEPRRARWSEATADIRALQSVVKDGPFAVAERDQPLLKASLSVCMIKHDDAGNTRLVKKGVNNTSRDDVAACLVLAGGAFYRANAVPPVRELQYATI